MKPLIRLLAQTSLNVSAKKTLRHFIVDKSHCLSRDVNVFVTLKMDLLYVLFCDLLLRIFEEIKTIDDNDFRFKEEV